MRDRIPNLALALVALSSAALLSCAGAPSGNMALESAETSIAPTDATAVNDADGQLVAQSEPSAVPQAPPQLIKTAELSVSVESVEPAIEAATAIARGQQGDVIELNLSKPDNASEPLEANLRLRVPQQNLDAFVEALSELGTVERQNLTAQDVSDQLVDLAARVRNLRKAEETLLGIMERTGAVADVLKVAQELNNTRAEIERIEAQRQDLSNRVAFSTVNVQFQLAGTAIPETPAIATQLGNTWQSASHSVSRFTLGLLKLSLWLLVYSPYWLAIAAIVWLILRSRSRRSTRARAVETLPPQP